MAGFNDIALRILLSAKDETQAGFSTAREGVRSISAQLAALEKAALRFLDLRIFVGFGQEVLQTVDKVNTLDARLKLATKTTEGYAYANKEVFRVAQEARTSLEATTNLYVKVDRAVRQLNGTQQQTVDITETVAKAVAMTSDGVQQDAAAILQFGQALGSANLAGDELRSILENSAGLAQALADGMGVPVTKMKEMGAAGELTGAKMVEALLKQKAVVDQQFGSMPVTVSQAITRVENAWLHYISTSDAARGASSAVVQVLKFVSAHFDTIADSAALLATIYGTRLVVSIGQTTTAFIAKTVATRAEAAATAEAARAAQLAQAARLKELQTTAAAAALKHKLAAESVEVALLQRSLASTTEKMAVAEKVLASAQNDRAKASEKSVAAANKYSDALAKVGPSAAKSWFGLERLVDLMNLASAAFIGWEIGTWLNRFEIVRQAGNYLAETLHIIATVAGHVFSGDIFRGSESLKAKIDTIRQGYADLRQTTTDAALAQEEASRRAAEAVEQAQQLAQEAFKKTQEKLRETSTVLESEYQRQNAAIDLALKARQELIATSGAAENVREQQNTVALQQALAQKLTSLNDYTRQRLSLLDTVYRTELEKDNQGVLARKAVEGQYLTDKRAAYAELATAYSGMVDNIIGQHAREIQAANQANEQLKQLAITSEQQVLELQRGAMSEREVLRSKEKETAAKLAQLKTEAAKGEAADQSKINRLHQELVQLILERSKNEQSAAKYQFEKTAAANKGVRELTEVNGIYQKSLEREKGLHEANAKSLLPSLTEANNSLTKVNGEIQKLDEQLAKDKLLKFNIDQTTLSDAKQTIAELTAPAEKIITIRTVNEGATEAKATGGPVGLALGGFPRRSGRLGGYGGGDRVRALLEAGEFIVRKEAVAQYGEGLFQALNSRAVNVARMALGGFVFQARQKQEIKPVEYRDVERDIEQLQQTFSSSKGFVTVPRPRLDEISQQLGRALATAAGDEDRRKIHALSNKLAEIASASNLAGEWLHRNEQGSWTTGHYAELPVMNNLFFQYAERVKRLQEMHLGGLVQRFAEGGPVASATAAAAARVSAQDAGPASAPPPGRTLTLQFLPPNGGAGVAGGFDERAAGQLFDLLKSAGARVL